MTPPAADPPRRLFLLDGHSLSYRAFFALPTSLATTSGQVTNAVYGFTGFAGRAEVRGSELGLASEHPPSADGRRFGGVFHERDDPVCHEPPAPNRFAVPSDLGDLDDAPGGHHFDAPAGLGRLDLVREDAGTRVDDDLHPVASHALLLCQAATAVKRSVGCSIEISVLKTTLVMWRLRARIASVLVLPSARFFAR